MDHREIEELWFRRVAEARARFDTARNRTNAVVRDFPLDGTSADGRYVYRSAIRLENAALAEYNRVLAIYEDLVHRGIVPDEDEWPRPDGAGEAGRPD